MVVFGCKVNRDGPGAMLKDRLDTVLDYLEDHPETNVVLSGGKGDDEHVSEARFHLTRIKMLWSRAGGTANVSTLAAPTSSLYTTVHMFFREPLALVKSFVFDR